jgi:exopolyphosphatase/guanosine-5'-triphosphate,3'-diphosphate pyrophosphatase
VTATKDRQRFAAIDVGTNTVLLLVVEIDEKGCFEVLEDRVEITRLGEGVDRHGVLSDGAQGRTLEALQDYVLGCRNFGVDEIALVGTSALREAKNSRNFIARLRDELSIDLRVLSGEEEACYAYLAAQRGLSLQCHELVVVDVGGGSTEFIWGRDNALVRWASLPLGSVRLTERFLHSDPVRDAEVASLIQCVDLELERLCFGEPAEPGFAGEVMVGIAGTFTTLAAIEKELKKYSHSAVHGVSLSQTQIKRQIQLFKDKTVAERKKIVGLEPGRADVILAGAVLIDRIMTVLAKDQVVVSDQGVRYGLLYEKLRSRHGTARPISGQGRR